MRNLRKYIKQYVRTIIEEILKESEVLIEYAKFKELDFDKKTIYQIIENFPTYGYTFAVEYFDPISDATCKASIVSLTLSDFRAELLKFSHPHEYIKSCDFSVKYKHVMGEQTAYDFIIGKPSKSSDVVSVIDTLVLWIDKHPELLV